MIPIRMQLLRYLNKANAQKYEMFLRTIQREYFLLRDRRTINLVNFPHTLSGISQDYFCLSALNLLQSAKFLSILNIFLDENETARYTSTMYFIRKIHNRALAIPLLR